MRSLSSLLLLALALPAAAVPTTLSQQGRLFDSTGLPLDGPDSVTFQLYDVATGGTSLWAETHTIDFDNGYFAVTLGDTSAVDSSLLDTDDRWIGITVGSAGTELPRMKLNSVPFALRADWSAAADHAATADSATSSDSAASADTALTATNLSGGTVDALSVTVNGVTVVDTGGSVPWSVISGAPADSDTLAGLTCSAGQILVSDGSAWGCADPPTGGGGSTDQLAIDSGHPATCDGSTAGRVYFNDTDTYFYGCDGSRWMVLGGGTGTIEASCAVHKTANPAAADGVYTIDPDGGDPSNAFSAYCDMSTDGGGWTILYASAGLDGDVGMASFAEIAGDPLAFEPYNASTATKRELSLASSESLIMRDSGQWLKADEPLFDAQYGDPTSHMDQTATFTAADGTSEAGMMGYSSLNKAGGGDYGMRNGSFDHHSSAYYHLQGSCVGHYLYSYSNNGDGDQSYKVNRTLGSWTATAGCSSSEGGGLAFYAAVR